MNARKRILVPVLVVLAVLACVGQVWAGEVVRVLGYDENGSIINTFVELEDPKPPCGPSGGLLYDDMNYCDYPSYKKYSEWYLQEHGEYPRARPYLQWLAEQAEQGTPLTAVEYASLATAYLPDPRWTDPVLERDEAKAKYYMEKAIEMAPDDYRVASAAAYYYGIFYGREGRGEFYGKKMNEWYKRFVELADEIDPNDESVQDVKNEIKFYENHHRDPAAETFAFLKTAPELVLESDKPLLQQAREVICVDPDDTYSLITYGSLAVIAVVLIITSGYEIIKKRRANRPRRRY